MDVGKSQRVPPFNFAALRFFSEYKNFPPFSFLMFCDRMDVEKRQRVPLSIFRHCESFFLKIVFSPKGPPSSSLIFHMLKIPKGSHLSLFQHCETYFRKFVFPPKGPPFNCNKNVDNFKSVPLLARHSVHFLLFRFPSTVN